MEGGEVSSVPNIQRTRQAQSRGHRRIATLKYERGAAFNRQHPFVDILLSDITESGELLDVSGLVREPLPPSFQRM
jgi:hypothetical protein